MDSLQTILRAARSSAAPSPGAAAGMTTSMGGSEVGPVPASSGMSTPDVGGAGSRTSGGGISAGLFSLVGNSPFATDYSKAGKAFGDSKVGMSSIAEGGNDVTLSGGSGKGRSTNQVGIIKISCEDLKHRCCGAVGSMSNLKMCIVTSDQCVTEKHKTQKHDVAGIPMTGHAYFINGSRTPGTSVQLEPHLHSDDLTIEAIQALDSLYLPSSRLPEAWTKIFDTLEQLVPRDGIEVAAEKLKGIEDVIQFSKDPEAVFSPMKHSAKIDSIESPTLEEGYDVPFFELTMQYPPDVTPSVEVITKEWPGLIKNYSSIRELMEGNQSATRALKNAVGSTFKDFDLFRSDYLKEVGRVPTGWGTASLFSVLESVSKRQEKAFEILEPLNEALSIDEGNKTIYGGLVTRSFDQIQQIFTHQQGNAVQTTNDLAMANAKIDALERKLDAAIAAGTMQPTAPVTNPFAPPTTTPMFQAAMQRTGAPASINNNPQLAQDMILLEQGQASLETRVNVLEATWAQSGNAWECGSLRFDTIHDVEAFVVKNGIAEKDLCFFPDLPALLNMAAKGGITSSKDSLNMRATSQKAGYATVKSAYVISSFDFEVPVFFGETSGNNDTFMKNRQVLPAAKTYEQWDNPKDRKGVSHILQAAVKTEDASLRKKAAMNLTPEALNISAQFLTEASASCASLSAYISQTMTNLTAKGMETTQAWDLVSMQVRGFWEQVDKDRSIGQNDYAMNVSNEATVLWGCIKGLLKVREFTQKAFEGHPVMSAIVNTFLRDNSVFKSEYDKLVKKLQDVERLAKGAKSSADRGGGKG